MAVDPRAWYDDDAFWEVLYPFMFPATHFEKAAEHVPLLEELTGCSGGALLDLGCGPGRYVVPFAKRGYAVTGVDRTTFLLSKARAYAEQEQVKVEFVQEDMRHFVRPGAYDIAINLYTTFGYFEDPADNQRVLNHVCASLRDGGVFVLDVMGTEVLAHIYRDSEARVLEDGLVLVQRRRAINDWREMDNYWTLIEGERARTFYIRHWIYTGFELRQMLLAAGFESVRLFGDFDGAEYGPDARRLIAVARKHDKVSG